MTSGPRPRPVRTVFLGSGEFGVDSLLELGSHPDVELVGVVTAPPRRAGRKGVLTHTPILEHVLHWRVAPTILTPEHLRSAGAIATVMALHPELLVLADYGQIVPEALLHLKHGALNLHPSLLPRHRGATPIPAAILAGDTETGVTLMKMDAGLDTGPILAQEHLALDGRETAPLLEDDLEVLASQVLYRHLGLWLRGEIEPIAQDGTRATLTRPLRREDGRLDPTRTARDLERQVRAYAPWPGSFVETQMFGRLIVEDGALAASESGDSPGRLVADGKGLALTTSNGRLRLGRVRAAGRKAMSAADLRRGAPGLVDSAVR